MPRDDTSIIDREVENGVETDGMIRKIAGLQSILPQFDNISAITPKFFVDNLEKITTLAKCTPEEKLLLMRSKIRGDALSNIINSPDLSQETNYEEFKRKFLGFFDTKYSLGARQKQFSNCKMLPNEQAKIYASKVALATQNFFNNPDLTNDAVKTIFENSKLAKFIEGLEPKYKQSVILKDPQTFQEAVDFVQTLQANEITLSHSEIQPSINSIINTEITNNDIKTILESHALHTQQIVNSLSKEIEKLKIQNGQNSSHQNTKYYQRENPQFFPKSFHRNYSNGTFHNQNNFSRYRSFPSCKFCNKNSHHYNDCFSNPANRKDYRGRGYHSFLAQRNRGQSRNRGSGHSPHLQKHSDTRRGHLNE